MLLGAWKLAFGVIQGVCEAHAAKMVKGAGLKGRDENSRKVLGADVKSTNIKLLAMEGSWGLGSSLCLQWLGSSRGPL